MLASAAYLRILLLWNPAPAYPILSPVIRPLGEQTGGYVGLARFRG